MEMKINRIRRRCRYLFIYQLRSYPPSLQLRRIVSQTDFSYRKISSLTKNLTGEERFKKYKHIFLLGTQLRLLASLGKYHIFQVNLCSVAQRSCISEDRTSKRNLVYRCGTVEEFFASLKFQRKRVTSLPQIYYLIVGLA